MSESGGLSGIVCPLGAIQENEFRRYLANATTLKVRNADVPFCSAIKVKVST